MDSDGHQASVLKKMVQRQSLSDTNIEDLVTALSRINSDSHAADVLKHISRLNLTEKQLLELFPSRKKNQF